ncbi:MAG: PD-(D/E)XK nuclease family protein [Verrucomicrobia bacterium]|nr:PD-(D/E)XK nuclease family protein [Verrucomicrobiota bacterium]
MHFLRVGPFSALESALGEHVAEVKRRHGSLTPVVIVVPTALLRLHLRRRLQDHVNIRFLTLADLIREATPDCKPLPPFAGELIAETVIADNVVEGDYFHPVKSSAGFRQCLLATIRDLKEAGIGRHELRSAAATAGLPKAKLVELVRLYEAYENTLQSHNVSDESDRLKEAIKGVSGSGIRVSGFKLKEVCLYGFYDFNHLQRRLVAALAARVELQVFVPFEDERAYDFARPTVAWFEGALGAKRQRRDPKSKARDPKSLQVLSAPGEARECRDILREALAFAREETGHPLRDVAVLSRGDEPYGPLLRDLTAARGWPLHLAMGRAPLEAIEPRLLLLLLDIAASDFARSKVMEFAALSPATTSRGAEWDRLSAELGIVAGASVWRDRVRARIKQLQMEQSHSDESKTAVAMRELVDARELGAFIEKLTRSVARLPQDGKWSEFTAATQVSAKELLADSPERETAFNQLRALDALDDYRASASREDFALYARKAFEAARLPEGAFQEGGPFVGGIMAARGVSWPMVIVPGLVEKGWPRQLREDPVLLDDERRELNKVLPAEDGMARLEEKVARGRDEERMLFRLACDAANEKLVITFPRIEPATGRPRVPSALLLDTLGVPNFSVMEKDTRVHKVLLTPLVPAEGDALDVGEFDYRLLEGLRREGGAGVTPLLDAMSPTLVPGLLLERTRWGGGRWTGYDGCLERPESLEVVQRLFDPAKHRWAISRLEAYARCPFSFFLREVLGVEELEEPEDAEGISALDFGSLFHELLRGIVQRFQMGNLLPLDPSRSVENEVVLDDEAMKVFGEFGGRGVTGHSLVWRVTQEKIRADLLRWLRLEYAHASDGYSPVATEWAFGRAADTPPAQIKLDEKTTLLVAGRIDRVDRGPGDEVIVLDYKTGKPDKYRNHSFCCARALQIPVYILATEQLAGKLCGGGLYFFATQRGGFEKRGWYREQLATAEPRLREILGCLTRSILAGKFFVTPDGADAAGTAMTKAAVEAQWEMKRGDESIVDYLDATAEDDNE